MEERICEGDEF